MKYHGRFAHADGIEDPRIGDTAKIAGEHVIYVELNGRRQWSKNKWVPKDALFDLDLERSLEQEDHAAEFQRLLKDL